MNQDEKKRVGREFIEQLGSKSNDIESFKSALKSFEELLPESRFDVAMGLLTIGADPSEPKLYRNFVFSQLAIYVRVCGLRNNKYFETRLSDVIDDWVLNMTDQELDVTGLASIWWTGDM